MPCCFGWDGFAPRAERSTRVTWGVFDGVHVGHQAVLDELVSWARREGAESIVLTFDPHPQVFLRHADIPLVLPVAERVRQIARRGVGSVLVLPFDLSLAELSPEAFVAEVLLGRLGAGGIQIGYDSRFGKGGKGTIDMLRALAQHSGAAVRTTGPRLLDGRPVKSSRLREAIARGDLAGASAMMGRPVILTGPVVHGDERGRTLGFPTANVDCRGLVLPPAGVYVVRGWEREAVAPGPLVPCDGSEEGPFGGVMNIGGRPTFGGEGLISVEVHFPDLPQGRNLYGKVLRIELVERLRGEQRFADVDSLKRQIAADCEAARSLLKGLR